MKKELDIDCRSLEAIFEIAFGGKRFALLCW
jgi:hypothetical protein